MKRSSFISLAVSFAIVTAVVQAQKTELSIILEEVMITVSPAKAIAPEGVSPATLCNLKVKLRNRGDRKVSSFGFTVRINGRDVAAYDKMLYLQAIDPGTTGELALSNFYSTEPGGSLPKDGKITVEVTVKQAQWVEIKKEGDTTVSTPLGEVKGLPVSGSVSKLLKVAG